MNYSVLILIIIIVMTWVMRLLPIAAFGRGNKIPAVISSLGNLMPPAVLVLLIVYCVRNATPGTYPFGMPEWIGIASTALLYKLTGKSLVAMIGGTVIYMIMVQAVFA